MHQHIRVRFELCHWLQVRGTEALQEFSNYLMQPHQPEERPEFSDQVTELQQQVGQLTHQCQHLQQQLDKAKAPTD